MIMFRRQVLYFMIMSSVLSIVGLGIALAGILAVDNGIWLGCAGQGERWLYLAIFGNGFELFHLIVLILYCVLALQIMYKVPKNFGRFKKEEPSTTSELKDITSGADPVEKENA